MRCAAPPRATRDSAEAGEALAIERRIVRARREIEKAVSVLAPAGEPFE